jgi:integration host factor subunit beta
LLQNDKVELRGFGSFKVKSRRSRQARNPRTGDAVAVPSKQVPYFKASNELKSRLNARD